MMGGSTGHITNADMATVYYVNDGCSGASYKESTGSVNIGLFSVCPTPCTTSKRYFVTSPGGVTFTGESHMPIPGSSCYDDSPMQHSGYVTVEITEGDIPFTLPVAMPLRFEYVSDYPSAPAVSNLGMVILVALLVGAGAFVMRKRTA